MPQPVKIVLGTRRISREALEALKPGSVVALAQGADENVRLIVASTTVGTGRLVTAGNNLAVQISSFTREDP